MQERAALSTEIKGLEAPSGGLWCMFPNYVEYADLSE